MARPRKERTFKGVELRGNEFSYRMRVPDPLSPSGMKQVRFGGFATAEEADRDRSKKKLEIYDKNFLLPTNATIAQYFPECLKTHGLVNEIKTQSLNDYFMHLNSYILPKIGHVPLKDCTSFQMQKFLVDLQKTGSRKGQALSASTIEKVAIILRLGFKEAYIHGEIQKNPMENVKIPKGQEKRVEHISDDDLLALRGFWLQSPQSAFFELALNTGARMGEILCLRWSDLDTKTNTISISKTFYLSNGVYGENSPKSKNGIREVEITPTQAQSLRSHAIRQKEQKLLVGSLWKDSDFIFANEIGEPLKSYQVRHLWKKLCVQSGVKMYHLHALRHTHITSLLRAGIQAYVVARRAGDTVTTILETYAHAIREDDSKCAEAFEGKMVAL
jgi:integrase